MTDESAQTLMLSYEPARRAAGTVVEELPGGGVLVDLPPVSNLVFVTIFVPWVHLAWLSVVMLLVVMSGPLRDPRSPGFAWVLMPLALTSAAYTMFMLARHRGARRIIRVDGGMLSYANAATAGRVVGVPGGRCGRIRVRRCWWRPWTVQIQAEPKVSFWSRSVNYQPNILLIDTDRARLEQIASVLRRALQLDAR